MKAVLSKEVGGPEALVLEEVPTPEAGKGQVLVEVKACGVNFPDSLMIQDLYQFKPPRPFSPGGEIAGVVKEVGEGVSHVKPGDRVLASIGSGGMAEYAVGGQHAVIPIPDTMPYDEAAAFMMTYGTSYYALKDRADPKPGEKLLVLGAAGGVGIAAVELGKAMGLEVIAACSTQEKVDFCLSKGADKGLVYPTGELDRGMQKELSQSDQGGFWRRCGHHLRRGGRQLCRTVPACDELGRPIPRDRIPRWHSRHSAQSDPFEELRYSRRVLGRSGCARSGGACGECERSLPALCGRQGQTPRLKSLSVGKVCRCDPGADGPQGAGQGGDFDRGLATATIKQKTRRIAPAGFLFQFR